MKWVKYTWWRIGKSGRVRWPSETDPLSVKIEEVDAEVEKQEEEEWEGAKKEYLQERIWREELKWWWKDGGFSVRLSIIVFVKPLIIPTQEKERENNRGVFAAFSAIGSPAVYNSELIHTSFFFF